MNANFFTKPLQGKTFKKFLCHIMNVEEDDPARLPTRYHMSVLGTKSKPKQKSQSDKSQIWVPRVKHKEQRTSTKENVIARSRSKREQNIEKKKIVIIN